MRTRVPGATVARLSKYSQYLKCLNEKKVTVVSSREIAREVGVSSAQVRKDLSYFGEFGIKGLGYKVKDLQQYTLRILGLTRPWPVIIVGAGSLGAMLCTCQDLRERGFRLVGIFDNDITKIKKHLFGLEILPLDGLPEVVRQQGVKIGIVAVSVNAVQEVADLMIKSGITKLLTFGPKVIQVPPKVEVRNIDIVAGLEMLTFYTGRKNLYKKLRNEQVLLNGRDARSKNVCYGQFSREGVKLRGQG